MSKKNYELVSFWGKNTFYLFTDSVIFDFPDNDEELEALKKEFKLGSPAYGAWKSETA